MDGAGASDTFRPDIEGLRGIAVLLVLLFHASLVGLPGGFIGVDVFFVISGYLITGLLIRERERTGRIALRAFYARRIRRLLPAGLVALVVTLVASFVCLAPLDRASSALDAAAAALSVGNIRFAIAAGDYFASVSQPSPFLHFWSLAVEEQFYLVWPTLVLAAAAVGRPRVGAGVALTIVLGTSLAIDVVLTGVAVNWAFYSLPARAWQLALGGLIAIGVRPLARVPRSIAAGAGWIGLGAIGVAALEFDGSLAYPGFWALVPALAAAALIAGGTAQHSPAGLLSTKPLRWLGRISYSLYLWHWPILVLPAAAIDGDLPIAARVLLAGLAIAVAWVSWRFIEEPFRTGFPSLAGRPGRTIFAGATAVVLVVSGAGGLAGAAGSAIRPPAQVAPAVAGQSASATPSTVPPEDQAAPSTAPTALVPPVEEQVTPEPSPPGPPSSPAPSSPPSPAAPSASAPVTPSLSPSPVEYIALPPDVRPALADVRGDEDRLRGDDCLAVESDTVPRNCVYGDQAGTFTVALVGDSHAAQWFPALEEVARLHGWRILTFVKVACPFLDIPVYNDALKREYDECRAYDEATLARLQALRPDLTLVSMSRMAIHPERSQDGTVGAQAASFARMLERLPGRIAIIVDTPDAGRDIPACLSRHPDDVRLCAVPSAAAFADGLGTIERAAARASGATLIDLTARVCRADPCPVVVDGMIVFRDARHLTATFAGSLAPDLDDAIAAILPTAGASPTPRIR